MALHDYASNPLDLLISISKNPDIWLMIDQLRQSRFWPRWCYVPDGAIMKAFVEKKTDIMKKPSLTVLLAALSGWRMTKRVYCYAKDLFSELISQPFDGRLPVDVLYQLPDWSCYIPAIHDLTLHNYAIHGFWTYINCTLNNVNELVFVGLKIEGGIIHHRIALERLTFDDCFAIAKEKAAQTVDPNIYRITEHRALDHLDSGIREHLELNYFSESVKNEIGTMLNLVLYLCAANSEMKKPSHPAENYKEGRKRIPSPKKAEPIRVGFVIGRAVRHHGDDDASNDAHIPYAQKGVKKRPHLRRPHYHTYYVGSGENRHSVLYYLDSIYVNADSPDELPVEIRPVKK